jgi:hypothetical protein
MNKTDVEVSTYKAHLLLIAKRADEMHRMASHYLTEVPILADAEPFVWAVLNMSKEMFKMADIDEIRDEVIKTMEKSPV